VAIAMLMSMWKLSQSSARSSSAISSVGNVYKDDEERVIDANEPSKVRCCTRHAPMGLDGATQIQLKSP